MRPDGKAREVVGIDQAVMDLFSSRRRAITKKTARLVAEFETKFGREPNSLELDRLQRTATLATRKAKSHDGETVAQRLERWDAQLRAEVRGGLGKVAHDVLALRQRQWLPGRVNETQGARDGTGRGPDRPRDLARVRPDPRDQQRAARQPGQPEAGQDRPAAGPADRARCRDGAAGRCPPLGRDRAAARRAASAPMARRRTPRLAPLGTSRRDHLKAERQLAAAGYARGAAAMTAADTEAFEKRLAATGLELGADQAAAVRGILTSGAKVETLVGPAGTGKSRVVGALAKAWEDPELWSGQQHRMVGLAASQVATEVLAADGVTAKNITRWLMTQQRIADGSASTEEQAWTLRDG